MAKKSKITKEEHYNLWTKFDWEGGFLGGYASYGPDYDLIAKLGFNKKEIKEAVELLGKVDDAISEGEYYGEEFSDPEEY